MRSICAIRQDTTRETANFLMLGRELHFPDELVSGRQGPGYESRETSEAMHDKLRSQQGKLRTEDSQELFLFQVA